MYLNLNCNINRIPSAKTFTPTYNWAAPCEKVSSGICRQQRPRSDCTSAESDQGLYSPLTESLGTTECMNGEQTPGPSCSKVTLS